MVRAGRQAGPGERTPVLRRLHLRPARSGDRREVVAILRKDRLEPVFYQKEFTVAEHRGRVIGCARLKFLGDAFELCSLGVSERYRRRGVGLLLARQCVERADGDVFCLTGRPAFFKGLGFRPIDRGMVPGELRAKLRDRCGPDATAMVHPGSPPGRIFRLLREKCRRDLHTTERALGKVRISVPPRSHYRRVAEDFLRMARSYFSDARHFAEKGDLVNAFASVNYAHGWLDAGARLGLFDVGLDDRLFTLAE